uniref:PABS domain-containing protein n=1 Tax=Panagrellus redivivus TaxID=6233 RepID=A0A7E4WBL6_PANRE
MWEIMVAQCCQRNVAKAVSPIHASIDQNKSPPISPHSPQASPTQRKMVRFRIESILKVLYGIIGVLLVVLVLRIVTSLPFRPKGMLDEHQGELSTADPLITKIDKQCGANGVCFTVVDIVIDTEGSLVQRATYADGFESEYDTVVALVTPKGYSYADSDTRLWAVNHWVSTTQYVAAMLCHPFGVSSLAMDGDGAGGNVLVIGLGGGNFDMLLHKRKPKLNITVIEIEPVVISIAEKWFAVKDDATRHTILADGITFMESARKQGHTYNAVILDACDDNKDLPCPAKVFRNPKVFADARAILSPMGVLVVNVLPLTTVPESDVTFILHQLLEHFPTCLIMEMSVEANRVISCLPYAISGDSVEHSRDLINDRLKKAAAMLGVSDAFQVHTLNLLSAP